VSNIYDGSDDKCNENPGRDVSSFPRGAGAEIQSCFLEVLLPDHRM